MAQDGDVKKAEFETLVDDPAGKPGSMDLIMDVPLEVTVELGRAVMSIKEICSLGVGSVVELDKTAGDPVDIYVNNKLIAKGEVVVIDENFGVRITSIVGGIGASGAAGKL